MTYTMVKTYNNYPCSHRQWRDKGHCAYIHGYSRSFSFTFTAQTLDDCGWVLGFQHLKPLKEHLEEMFDHTMLIAKDDPMMQHFIVLQELGIVNLRILDSVGMEGSAQYLYDYCNQWLSTVRDFDDRLVRCVAVEARENDKNAAVYSL